MYGTLASLSILNPAGFNTRLHSLLTPSSQPPSDGSGSRSLGGRFELPSSTNGRNGITTARSNRPTPGRNIPRSCESKVNGVSQRSRTLRSAIASKPSGESRFTFSFRAASNTPETSAAPMTQSKRLSFRRFTIGGDTSVATTASKQPPSRSFSVTSPSPAPTSRSTPPPPPPPHPASPPPPPFDALFLPSRSSTCARESTCIFPLPKIAFASVSDMRFRRYEHATDAPQFTTYGRRLLRIKNAFVASSRSNGANARLSSSGSRARTQS
mmetsp:Transcript_11287/g.40752  ORF Transcript_11287/g.40752 Transcript_11287/m.40752 type:complete len:269 (+) Transcript_11287:197-1003(+)